MIVGVLLTALALGTMVVWSLHEIRRVDSVPRGRRRPAPGGEEDADGQG